MKGGGDGLTNDQSGVVAGLEPEARSRDVEHGQHLAGLDEGEVRASGRRPPPLAPAVGEADPTRARETYLGGAVRSGAREDRALEDGRLVVHGCAARDAVAEGQGRGVGVAVRDVEHAAAGLECSDPTAEGAAGVQLAEGQHGVAGGEG